MITYNYKMVHSSTKLTPNEASNPSNLLQAKLNMEMHAKHSRKYPPLEVGDLVKPMIHTKFRKEHVSPFSKNSFKIFEINNMHGQDYYKIDGHPKLYLRYELLKT